MDCGVEVVKYDMMQRDQRVACLVNSMIKAGLSKDVSIGVVSSIWAESGLSTTSENPTSKAYGLAQWLVKGKDSRGRKFKEVTGKDIHSSTAEEQFSFMMYELNTYEQASWARLKQATTSKEGADIWTMVYERPAKQGTLKGQMEIRKHRKFIGQVEGIVGLGNAKSVFSDKGAVGYAVNVSDGVAKTHSSMGSAEWAVLILGSVLLWKLKKESDNIERDDMLLLQKKTIQSEVDLNDVKDMYIDGNGDLRVLADRLYIFASSKFKTAEAYLAWICAEEAQDKETFTFIAA